MPACASATVITDAGVIRRCNASGSSSQIVSRTPVGSSTALTDRPVMPAPVTRTRVPGTNRERSSISGPDGGEPLAVEERDAQPAGDRRQQPEADDHRRLRPADQLEVVMEGRHPEDPSPGG